MTPRQGRRLLRMMNRRDRHDSIAGIFTYRTDSSPPGQWYVLRADGVPIPSARSSYEAARQILDANPVLGPDGRAIFF